MKFKNIKTKEEARQVGIEFQNWASEQNLSYGELSSYQNKLHKIAKRFGLIREFRENGIL
jgi:predicted  nucleic acid-binding Zn-ribbon protein